MLVFRIGSADHPLLDGSGAAASDVARWNTRGRFIIYASEHYATAVIEKMVQLNGLTLPRTLVYVAIDVPAHASSEEVREQEVAGWDADNRTVSQDFGDRWYDERRSLVLLVPSLAAPGLERNVLINQRHPEFAGVTASPAQAVRCHPKLFRASQQAS